MSTKSGAKWFNFFGWFRPRPAQSKDPKVTQSDSSKPTHPDPLGYSEEAKRVIKELEEDWG